MRDIKISMERKTMSKEKEPRIDIRLPSFELKEDFQNTCRSMGISMTDQINSLIVQTINNQKELIGITIKHNNKREQMFNSVSIVDTFKREKDVVLPSELVDMTTFENSVLFERVSGVLSLNKIEEAYQFCMGIMNIIDNLPKNSQIIFSETDSKGRISTKLFRNLFGNAIIFVLIKALDEGHTIHTYTDTLNPVYTEHLFELLSEGISTSIHERTKVYDNLFFMKYNKAHFNQWLQWSFGLSRRNPITEFNRLLRKNPNLMKPNSEEEPNELQIRSKVAIENLRKRYTLFGLSDNGLKLAIEKIQTFTLMYENYANDYNPIQVCKNAKIHHVLIATNQKCPLKCGLKTD